MHDVGSIPITLNLWVTYHLTTRYRVTGSDAELGNWNDRCRRCKGDDGAVRLIGQTPACLDLQRGEIPRMLLTLRTKDRFI